MDRRTHSRRRSSISENGSVLHSAKNKGKRKLDDLDHVVGPAKKSRQRISIREQKLLKLHGINFEIRVNLQRLKPFDIKIFNQKYLSECRINDGSDKNKINSEIRSFEGFENENSSERDNSLVNSNNKNLDVTDKTKLITSKIVTEKLTNLEDNLGGSSDCKKNSTNEDLRNIRNNSCTIKDSEKNIGTKSEDHSAAIKLIEERLKNIKKNPLALNDLDVSVKSLKSDNCKVIPLTSVNHTKVNSLKEDSCRSLSSSNSITNRLEDLKSVRLNSTQDELEQKKSNATTKPLIILDVDAINNSVSTENKESNEANNINCNEKNVAPNDKLVGLNFKPPPIREFTLKDFGLDSSPKLDTPSTSETIKNDVDKYIKDKLSATSQTMNNNVNVDKNFKEKHNNTSNTIKYDVDKYLKERFSSVRNEVPRSDELKPVPVIKNSQEEKIKKYSLEELGLSSRKVLTLGLKDFTEPNSLVFGVGDFKVKTPNGGRLSNCQDDLRKSLRNFRLNNLRDVKVKSKSETASDTNITNINKSKGEAFSDSNINKSKPEAVSDTNINTKSINNNLHSVRKEETSGKDSNSKTGIANENLVNQTAQTASVLVSEGSNTTSAKNVESAMECSSGKKIGTDNLNGIDNESSLCLKENDHVLDNKRTSTTNCANKEVESVSKRTDSNDVIIIDLVENHDENSSTIDYLNSKSASIDNIKNREQLDNSDSQSEADKNNLSSTQKLPSCDNSVCELKANADCLNKTVHLDDNLNKLATGTNAINCSTDIELNSNAFKSQIKTVLESSTIHNISILNTGCLNVQKEVSNNNIPKDSLNNSDVTSKSDQNIQNYEVEILDSDVIANAGERTGDEKETNMINEGVTHSIITGMNGSNTTSDVSNLNKCVDVTIEAVSEIKNLSVNSKQLSVLNTGCLSVQKEVSNNDVQKDLMNNSDITSKSDQNIPNCEVEILASDVVENAGERTGDDKETTMIYEAVKHAIIKGMNSSNTTSDVNNLNKCVDVTMETVSEIKNLSVNNNQLENNIAEVKVSEVPENEVRTLFTRTKNVLPNTSYKTISPNFPFMHLSLGGMVSQNAHQIQKTTSVVRNSSDIYRTSNNELNQENENYSMNYDESLCDVEIHEESISEVCDFDNDYDDDDDIIEIASQDLDSGKNNDNTSGIKSSDGNANKDKDLEIIMENQVKRTSDNQVILIEPEQNLLSTNKKTENKNDDLIHIAKNKKTENKNDDLIHIAKRLKSNDYSIKNLFLSSKKNTLTFPPNKVSNLNRRSNNLKENKKFHKEERIEDCSYDYPKFSVLDTEGLIHSYRNLVCGSCFKHVDVKFANTLSSSSTEFEVECFSCNHVRRFKRSKSCVNEVDFSVTGFDNLYLKLVYSCLDFGGGYRQLQSTCLALNIPHLNKKSYEMYSSYIIDQAEVKLNTVLNATSEIVHNAYEKNGISASAEGIREINILMDCWIPKGKKDKYSLVVAVDLLTGLVVDFYLIINYCRNCLIMRKKKNFESWKLKHKSLGQCHLNWNYHENNMESEASQILCSRSEQKYKFKYSCATSDVLCLSHKSNFNHMESETVTEENYTIKKTVTCDLNLSDTVEKSEIDYIESDVTSSILKPKEIASDISPISEINSKTEQRNLKSSPHNDQKSVLNSSTPVKVSVDSFDSNGTLGTQSTSSELTLTNINSISNSDSDKELQEFNKSPNHVLEEINIDLNLDLDSLVPSVTSSDTLSEGLLESNGVLVHRDGLSLTDNEPLSIGAMNHLDNQCSNANINETSLVSKILIQDVQNVSETNNELLNMIPKVISDKKEAPDLFQKLVNENSTLNTSKKMKHDDSTTVGKQLASIVNVNKELVNKEVVLDIYSVSESKKEFSNMVPERISDKNFASIAFQKSDNVNSVLNISQKITHDDDSIIAIKQLTSIVNASVKLNNKVAEQTTSTKNNNPVPQSPLKVDSTEVGPIIITNEKQDENLMRNDKLNNSLTYDEHREMASLLASNVVDQDASTDFEKSVSKENIVIDLEDDDDNLKQNLSVRNKDLNCLLNEESREKCTINEVELMEVDESVNEKSGNVSNMSILNKDSEEIELVGKEDETRVEAATVKAGSIKENTDCSSETENIQNKIKAVPSSVEEDTIALSNNINVLSVNNSNNVKESYNNSQKIYKMIKRARKESLRSNVLKCCNSSAPITKELVEFACSQAIISHNINIQNLSSDCSNDT